MLEVEEERLPYQMHRKYIINHIKSGIIVVDQQKAHERILFEKMIQAIANNKMARQQMLFPLTIELSTEDTTLLQSVSPELNGMGFDISEFGQGSIIINGIPSVLKESSVRDTIEQILCSLNDEEQASTRFEEKLAKSISKAQSIKSGQLLNVEEMQNLVDELFACEQPFYTATGKPTTVTISLEEFEKKFDS